MNNDSAVLDYETLVEEYNNGLTTVLRGFRGGTNFLEMWVPDEDVAKSVVNLAEAAEAAGVPAVTLFIGPQALGGLDLDRLRSMMAGLARVDAHHKNGGLLLGLSELGANPQ